MLLIQELLAHVFIGLEAKKAPKTSHFKGLQPPKAFH